MTVLERSTSAMNTVANFVTRQQQGEVLSFHEVQAAYGELVVCYGLVGLELATAFKPKEASYLARRVAQSKAYIRGRYDEKLKLAVKDAEMQSLLDVGEEINAEIENSSIYEGLRILRESLDRAIDYCRSLVSSLRKEERHV